MTLIDLQELLSVLKEFGVTSYSYRDLAIELKPPDKVEDVREELDDVETAFPPQVKADGLTEEEQVLLYGKVMP